MVNKSNEKIEDLAKEIKTNKEKMTEFSNTLSEITKNLEESSKVSAPPKPELENPQKKAPKQIKGQDPMIQSLMGEISAFKESLQKSAKETEDKLIQEVEKNIKFLNEKVTNIKQENEESFKIVNEKLSWFPVNVSSMSGMTPNEARLFTIEARLRSEENSRIKSFNFLGKMIEGLKFSKEISSFQEKNFKDKRITPEGIYTVDVLKEIGKFDRKDFKDYSHLLGGSLNDEQDFISKLKTPKVRDFSSEFVTREARTSSVLARNIIRKH